MLTADEAFVTGTFGGMTPVREVDGRALPQRPAGPGDRAPSRPLRKLKDEDAATSRAQDWFYQRGVEHAERSRRHVVGSAQHLDGHDARFENRPDTAVVDEPFYAAYLAETGLDHPMREEVIASQPTDWREVVKDFSGRCRTGAASSIRST